MIGRSHAMLGAAGYLSFVAVSAIEVPDNVLIYGSAAAGVLTPVMVLIPSGIQAQRTRETYFRDMTYKFFYRILGFMYLALTFSCIAIWINKLFPQLIPTHPGHIILWAAVATGWALVPDLDEMKSTIANEFGALSRGFSRFTRKVAGGHRMATHSWIMVVLVVGLSFGAVAYTPIAGFVIGTSFVFAIRVILPEKAGKQATPFMFIAATSGFLVALGSIDSAPMLVAAPLGVLLHDLGDWFTRAGITFWYPYRKKYGIGAMRAGSPSEYWFAQPIMMTVIMISLFYMSVLPIIKDPAIVDPSGIITHYAGISQITKGDLEELWAYLSDMLPVR